MSNRPGSRRLDLLSALRAFAPVLLVAAGALALAGCAQEQAPQTYVARVGTQYLTESDIDSALSSLALGRDSVEARQQFIEQWVTRALLFDEARRRGLHTEPAVQQQLEASERSVLTSALIDRIYEEAAPAAGPAEARAFFEENKEQLRLSEPLVRVRYLATERQDAAERAREALQRAALDEAAEARWPEIVQQFAADTAYAQALAGSYVPERRLFGRLPEARDWLERLALGEIAPVFEADSAFHLLQLVDRAPAGSEPRLAWVEDQVRRRLTMEVRKQTVARQVQRLRNEAAARGELDVP